MKRECSTLFFIPLLGLVVGLVAGTALADPPNTPVLDGRPLEYDIGDLRGTFPDAPTWGPDNVISNLYVTWDADALYVALHGYTRQDDAPNKLAVLVDVAPGAGKGMTTTLNWINTGEPAIDFNGAGWVTSGVTPFGADYMIVSEGTFNNLFRILYDGEEAPVLGGNVEALFDSDNGSNPTGGPVDMATLRNAGPGCNLLAMEARIPWDVLYDPTILDNGSPRFGVPGPGGVPTGATIRVVAILHNNIENDPYSSPDAIPPQVGANSNWDDGLLTTDDYIDVVIDGTGDGTPDFVNLPDTNGPWLTSASGAEGGTTALLQFNKAVDAVTAENPDNYSIAGITPTSANLTSDRIVILNLPSPLPDGSTARLAIATDVEDTAGNSRTLPAEVCFFPTVGGIDEDVTVTFVLETDSGMGISPGASEFFINGGALPLEWGFPPATNIPLTQLSGTLYSVDITFPAGSPSSTFYKYSAILNNTGTNNYEAIRLDKWDEVSRPLELPNDGSSLVITDYLGAAAGPWRTGDSGRADLYADARRGDAGVRQRHTILFQLDLSLRVPPPGARVMVLGSDPLRGFNWDGVFADFPSSLLVGWADGAIELFDDGTHGDLVAGDGIYSRVWSFTEDGLDPVISPEFPNSLVDPGFAVGPYFGSWVNRRSPRSFIFKYFIKDMNDPDPDVFWDSPSQDIELYLEHDAPEHIVLPPHVWDNPAIPIVSESFPAEFTEITPVGDDVRVVFTNILQATDNELQVADDLTSNMWGGYGLIATGSGVYTVMVENAVADSEIYRVLTPGRPTDYTWWEPAFLPDGGGTVRIWFQQRRKNLGGVRQIYWFGANPGPGGYATEPMTFAGDGLWYIDLDVVGTSGQDVRFLFIDRPFDPEIGWIPGTREDKNMHPDGSNVGTLGGDFSLTIGGRATWAPDPVQPGQDLTITYDAVGGPLFGASEVNIWLDFDGWEDLQPWNGAEFEQPMTSIGPNLWEITIPVPVDTQATANFVFKTPDGAAWDGNQDSNGQGRDWQAFVRP